MIAAHRNTTSKGFIAIDDITVREGPCGDQSMYSKTIKGLMLKIQLTNNFALPPLHLFQTGAGLIMTCATFRAASATRVNGFANELQRKRWIIPMEQIMVSKNHHH